MHITVAALITGFFGLLSLNFEFIITALLQVEAPVKQVIIVICVVITALIAWTSIIQAQLIQLKNRK